MIVHHHFTFLNDVLVLAIFFVNKEFTDDFLFGIVQMYVLLGDVIQ
jgi:hypothetical protein